MKIAPEINIELLKTDKTLPEVERASGGKFSEVKNSIEQEFKDSFLDLDKLENILSKQGEVDAKSLLLYQIQVGKLGLRTELISKVGESLLSTTRKLQGTGQA
ncbi:MAG: hypothetical protein R3A13_12520 [Bdellovibrionota bacterium]